MLILLSQKIPESQALFCIERRRLHISTRLPWTPFYASPRLQATDRFGTVVSVSYLLLEICLEMEKQEALQGSDIYCGEILLASFTLRPLQVAQACKYLQASFEHPVSQKSYADLNTCFCRSEKLLTSSSFWKRARTERNRPCSAWCTSWYVSVWEDVP